MRALRDIARRKLRSSLTIFGISIGVFTMVVLGAFAENASVTLETADDFYEERITIADAQDVNSLGQASGNRPLSMAKIDEIKKVQGVIDVAPQFAMLLDPNQPVSGGSPNMVLGGYMGTKKRPEKWRYSDGRGISETETGVAVVGPNLARQLRAEVGKGIKVHGKEFKVVGIMESTLTLLDQSVFISFKDARDLFVESLPLAVRRSVDKEDLAMNFLAYAEKGEANDLAARINSQVSGVKATGIIEMKEYMGQIIAAVGALLVSIGALALLIGGLSVVNTMTMSVSERKKEIGVKRAMGASSGRIVRDILAEAALMSALGGILGIGAGILSVGVINSAMVSSMGTVVFMITARLVFGAIVFSVAIGVLAGFFPARRAASMSPTTAMGFE
ncbi:MAG: ABC transporter permease [Candidatus Aquicultorales bacterium]